MSANRALASLWTGAPRSHRRDRAHDRGAGAPVPQPPPFAVPERWALRIPSGEGRPRSGHGIGPQPAKHGRRARGRGASVAGSAGSRGSTRGPVAPIHKLIETRFELTPPSPRPTPAPTPCGRAAALRRPRHQIWPKRGPVTLRWRTIVYTPPACAVRMGSAQGGSEPAHARCELCGSGDRPRGRPRAHARGCRCGRRAEVRDARTEQPANLLVVYTYQEPDSIRLISAWKANRRQREAYEEGRG
jgi:hypothetical protein